MHRGRESRPCKLSSAFSRGRNQVAISASSSMKEPSWGSCSQSTIASPRGDLQVRNKHFPSSMSMQYGEDALIEKLSEREQEVLNLIAGGLSNYEIAQKLVVTVSTIKTHLNNIYAKLHVHTRLQAVTKAYDVGVLRRGEVDTEPLTHLYSPEKMRYRTRTR